MNIRRLVVTFTSAAVAVLSLAVLAPPASADSISNEGERFQLLHHYANPSLGTVAIDYTSQFYFSVGANRITRARGWGAISKDFSAPRPPLRVQVDQVRLGVVGGPLLIATTAPVNSGTAAQSAVSFTDWRLNVTSPTMCGTPVRLQTRVLYSVRWTDLTVSKFQVTSDPSNLHCVL
jgi:hypothetical protein